jgi:hypothetical protein
VEDEALDLDSVRRDHWSAQIAVAGLAVEMDRFARARVKRCGTRGGCSRAQSTGSDASPLSGVQANRTESASVRDSGRRIPSTMRKQCYLRESRSDEQRPRAPRPLH